MEISHEFIPSRANLRHRHIERLSNCELCGATEEITFHVLTECTFPQFFWMKMTGIKLPKLCPRTWTADLLDDSFCLEGDRGVVLCGMWSLWNSRNGRRHGKPAIQPHLAIDWALEACSHLLMSRLNPRGEEPAHAPERWKKPPDGHVKVNTDGAFRETDSTGVSATVVVISREHGSS